MANYTRNTVTGNLAPVNAELEKIEQSLKEKLDRKPSVGQANSMSDTLDMNSQRLINLPKPLSATDAARLQDIPSFIVEDNSSVRNFPEAFGAVGDGVTDDTQAFNSMIASGINHINLMNKTYVINGQIQQPTSGTFSIKGEGKGVSVILWKGDALLPDGEDLFVSNGWLDSLIFQDFTLQGTHDINRTNTSNYPCLITLVKKVYLYRVEVIYSKTMGIAVRNATNAVAQNCLVHFCARDGINFADCDHTVINANTIEYIDDDAIAVHNQTFSDQRGHVISNNLIRFAQGIKNLGAHVSSITGNVLDYCFAQGISVVSASSGIEGLSTNYSLSIIGNTVSNMVDRAVLDNRNSGASYLKISNASARAGGEVAIPSRYPSLSGVFVEPVDFSENIKDGAADPANLAIADGYGIVVQGNTFMRNASNTGTLTSRSLPLFWLRDGEYDIDYSSNSTWGKIGFDLSNGVTDVSLTSNYFYNINNMLNYDADTRYDSIYISNCQFVRASRMLIIPTNSGTELNTYFSDCLFDLDPYHTNTNRNADGSWISGVSTSAFYTLGARSIHFKNCHWWNMATLTHSDWDTIVQQGDIEAEGNCFYMQYPELASDGFSSSNKGIGYLPSTGGKVIYTDCTPTSANFRNILNVPPSERNFIPTDGFFVEGHTVWSTNPVISGTSILIGWKRLRTGSGHVLDTDWSALYASTVV